MNRLAVFLAANEITGPTRVSQTA